MTPKPTLLHSSDSIELASKTFFKLKITSAPVVSLTGEVIGQLTELGLLRALVMYQLQPEKFSKLEHCHDFFDVAHFVAPGDPISTVIRTMIKCPSRRILVRNARQDLLGIISPKDLLRLLKSGASGAVEVQKEIKKLST